MKKTIKLLGIITFVAVIGFSMAACGGGEKSITSADALKEYLDSRPANGPDKPIKVAMKINENMVDDVREAINSAGKYVSLNLTGSPLTTIPVRAFKDCKSLVGITLPAGVTEIGGNAFEGTSLTSIIIPNSVTSIGNWAFYGCESLTSVTIPNSVTTIGASAFRGCTGLIDVIIPASVTSIDREAFSNCTGLTSITIPANVTSIGNWAFSDCTNLTSVTFAIGSTINSANFLSGAFPQGISHSDNLKASYLAGGAGTYTRDAGGNSWTKTSDGNPKDILDGTTWKESYYGGTCILSFNSPNFADITTEEGQTWTWTATYTVSGNTVTLEYEDGLYEGTLSGNTLVFDGEWSATLTKQ